MTTYKVRIHRTGHAWEEVTTRFGAFGAAVEYAERHHLVNGNKVTVKSHGVYEVVLDRTPSYRMKVMRNSVERVIANDIRR